MLTRDEMPGMAMSGMSAKLPVREYMPDTELEMELLRLRRPSRPTRACDECVFLIAP